MVTLASCATPAVMLAQQGRSTTELLGSVRLGATGTGHCLRDGRAQPGLADPTKGATLPVNNHHRIIISDMDRTLVDFTSLYLGAYRVAVREAYGIDGQPTPRRHAGYTQAAVVRMICKEHGLDDQTTEAGVDKALQALSATVISLLEEDLRYGILPGVEQVFDALQRQGHALVLVTGTISPIAQAIMARSGLDRFFPARACGDEVVSRVELLQLAMRRAHDTYDIDPDWNDAVVMGDAVTDIEAGKAVGARVVAVATGHHSVDELDGLGADVVLPDLSDCRAALAAILGE